MMTIGPYLTTGRTWKIIHDHDDDDEDDVDVNDHAIIYVDDISLWLYNVIL